LGGLNPFGYHVVNFSIHALAVFVLFFFTCRILRLSRFGKFRNSKVLISAALLSAALWGSHPIQVTAVTYIVQRMAALAALFTLLSMFSYVEARTSRSLASKAVYAGACLIFGALAVGSKENAAMLPANVMLLEIFIINGQRGKHRRFNFLLFTMAAFLVVLIGLWFTDIGKILNGYGNRPFTLGQRLMTEPRIFLFYISLLLFPINERFTILHDVDLSIGLFSPWTTFPAMLLVLAMPILAWAVRSKTPLLSFSILFFWINHLIEGSVIPLELIFEHRNYLASMFLFLPPSIGFIYLTERYSKKHPLVVCSFALLAVFIWAQGHTVYMRNGLFRDPVLLWKDNVEKSPDLHRPHHNLARAYYAAGRTVEALFSAQRALTAKAMVTKNQKYITWYNIGLYFLYTGEFEKARTCFEKALQIEPKDANIYHKMAVIHRIEGNLDLAERNVMAALEKSHGAPAFLPTLGMILLQKGQEESVIQMAAEQLRKPSANDQWYYLLGEAFRRKGELARAAACFTVYARAFPDQMAVQVALLEIYSMMGRENERNRTARHLLCQANAVGIINLLNQYDRRYNTLGQERIQTIKKAMKYSVIFEKFHRNNKGSAGIIPEPPL
jgi:tetratricopeptide (TPR) repeat protein